MSHFEAAFFDLDGTLQDSEVLWVEATSNYIHANGGTITKAQACALVYGKSWTQIATEAKQYAPSLIPKTLEEMANEARCYYKALANVCDLAIPDSVTLLHKLSQTMPVAIVSGSPCKDIELAIEYLKISEDVDFYIGAEDYENGKPDPTCYTLAAQRLNISPEKCLVFEDSEAGITAGNLAGMYTVALDIPNRPKQNFAHAREVLTSLALWKP